MLQGGPAPRVAGSWGPLGVHRGQMVPTSAPTGSTSPGGLGAACRGREKPHADPWDPAPTSPSCLRASEQPHRVLNQRPLPLGLSVCN